MRRETPAEDRRGIHRAAIRSATPRGSSALLEEADGGDPADPVAVGLELGQASLVDAADGEDVAGVVSRGGSAATARAGPSGGP